MKWMMTLIFAISNQFILKITYTLKKSIRQISRLLMNRMSMNKVFKINAMNFPNGLKNLFQIKVLINKVNQFKNNFFIRTQYDRVELEQLRLSQRVKNFPQWKKRRVNLKLSKCRRMSILRRILNKILTKCHQHLPLTTYVDKIHKTVVCPKRVTYLKRILRLKMILCLKRMMLNRKKLYLRRMLCLKTKMFLKIMKSHRMKPYY